MGGANPQTLKINCFFCSRSVWQTSANAPLYAQAPGAKFQALQTVSAAGMGNMTAPARCTAAALATDQQTG